MLLYKQQAELLLGWPLATRRLLAFETSGTAYLRTWRHSTSTLAQLKSRADRKMSCGFTMYILSFVALLLPCGRCKGICCL